MLSLFKVPLKVNERMTAVSKTLLSCIVHASTVVGPFVFKQTSFSANHFSRQLHNILVRLGSQQIHFPLYLVYYRFSRKDSLRRERDGGGWYPNWLNTTKDLGWKNRCFFRNLLLTP